MASEFRQDLPPPGGYARILYKRIPQRPFLNGYLLIGGVTAMMVMAGLDIIKKKRRGRIFQIEENDVNCAIEPLLLAERDRAYLKQLKINREEEEKLMKDVPGWKVGTLYGEPVFKTIPPDLYVELPVEEYYAHTHNKHLKHLKFIEAYHY